MRQQTWYYYNDSYGNLSGVRDCMGYGTSYTYQVYASGSPCYNKVFSDVATITAPCPNAYVVTNFAYDPEGRLTSRPRTTAPGRIT